MSVCHSQCAQQRGGGQRELLMWSIAVSHLTRRLAATTRRSQGPAARNCPCRDARLLLIRCSRLLIHHLLTFLHAALRCARSSFISSAARPAISVHAGTGTFLPCRRAPLFSCCSACASYQAPCSVRERPQRAWHLFARSLYKIAVHLRGRGG